MKEKLNCKDCPWYSFADEQCNAPWEPGYDVACWVPDDEEESGNE